MAKSSRRGSTNQAQVSNNEKNSDEPESFARIDTMEFILAAGMEALHELVETKSANSAEFATRMSPTGF